MKRLYCLLAVLLLGGLAQTAHAFQFKVLDPSIYTDPLRITGPGTYTFSFLQCPPGIAADGCILAINTSQDTFNFADFTFPNTSALGGQDADCVTTEPGSLFDQANPCGVTGETYVLDFYGSPGIPPSVNTEILIEENDIPYADFPTVTATFGTTPEPASLWMLASATMFFGLLVGRRKGLLAGRRS